MKLWAQSPQLQYQLTRIDISEGLSANQVNCILKDSQGFMWFGTMSGLNRYDGYSFKVFRQDLRDAATLSDNFVTGIMEGPGGLLFINNRNGQNIYDPGNGRFQRNAGPTLRRFGVPVDSVAGIITDQQQNYWFITATDGLYYYHTDTKKTEHLLAGSSITALAQDPTGYNWLLHADGVLEKMDPHDHKIIYRDHMPPQPGSSPLQHYDMIVDRDGDCWIYSNNDVQGIYCYNQGKASFTHYDQNSSPLHLNNNIVRGVVQDNQGLIWIGTDHGGMNVIDKKRKAIVYLTNNIEDPKSLPQNSINALYRDNSGIIWIGTYKKGIAYYHEDIVKFPLYQHQPFLPNSLPYDDVNRFAEDAAGNLWIGTNGGGLIYYDRSKNIWRHYLHDATNPNTPSGNVIVSLWIDHQQRLWIGSYFGGLDCYENGRFRHYRHDPADPTSLSDNSVWEVYEDSHERLWIGTLNGGLNLLDPATGHFAHYPNVLHSTYISALLEDHTGNLWIGTADGLD